MFRWLNLEARKAKSGGTGLLLLLLVITFMTCTLFLAGCDDDPELFTLSLDINPIQGGNIFLEAADQVFSGAGDYSFAEGEVIILSAVPYSGYGFHVWGVGPGGTDGYSEFPNWTFTMPGEDYSLFVDFYSLDDILDDDMEEAPDIDIVDPNGPHLFTLSLEINPIQGGNIFLETADQVFSGAGDYSFAEGEVIILSAVPYSGTAATYVFHVWGIGPGGIDGYFEFPNLSFTMPGEDYFLSVYFYMLDDIGEEVETGLAPDCWDYQPTDLAPGPGWDTISLEGLGREELVST